MLAIGISIPGHPEISTFVLAFLGWQEIMSRFPCTSVPANGLAWKQTTTQISNGRIIVNRIICTDQNHFKDDDTVCYCFHYTKKQIEDDYRNNGRSTILEKIRREKQSGGCDCASKNPKGRWCIADFRQVVDSAAENITWHLLQWRLQKKYTHLSN